MQTLIHITNMNCPWAHQIGRNLISLGMNQGCRFFTTKNISNACVFVWLEWNIKYHWPEWKPKLTNFPNIVPSSQSAHYEYAMHKLLPYRWAFDCETLWLAQFCAPIICLAMNHLLTVPMLLITSWEKKNKNKNNCYASGKKYGTSIIYIISGT